MNVRLVPLNRLCTAIVTNWRKAIITIVAGILAVTVLLVAGSYVALRSPASRGKAREVTVIINPGDNTTRVVEELARRGVLKHPLLFRLSARLQGLERRIRAGEYALNTNLSTEQVLDVLTSGKVVQHRVTIPEGFSLASAARRLEQAGFGSATDYIALAKQPSAVFGGQIPAALKGVTSLEGYLFPDTYDLTRGETPAQILRRMVSRFLSVAVPLYRQSPLRDRYTLSEVVTMASLVEGEAKHPPERPAIAGVFYNRLARGMALQSCATVEYVLGEHKAALTFKDLAVDSPYNTYLHAGLPPGPINNPGRASLMAATNPAKVQYLYFVAKGDGTHAFSSTFAEHLSAQRKYEDKYRAAK